MKNRDCCRSCRFFFLLLQIAYEGYIASRIAFQVLIFYYLTHPLQIYYLHSSVFDNSSSLFDLMGTTSKFPYFTLILFIFIIASLSVSLCYHRCKRRTLVVMFQILAIIGIVLRLFLLYATGLNMQLLLNNSQIQDNSDLLYLIPLFLVSFGPHFLILLVFILLNPCRSCLNLHVLTLGSLLYSLQQYTFQLNLTVFMICIFYDSSFKSEKRKKHCLILSIVSIWLAIQFIIFFVFYLFLSPQAATLIIPLIVLLPTLFRLIERFSYCLSCQRCRIYRIQKTKKRVFREIPKVQVHQRRNKTESEVSLQEIKVENKEEVLERVAQLNQKELKPTKVLSQKELSDSGLHMTESAESVMLKSRFKEKENLKRSQNNEAEEEKKADKKLEPSKFKRLNEKDKNKEKLNPESAKKELTQQSQVPDTLRYFSPDNTARREAFLNPMKNQSHSSKLKVPDELSDTFMNQADSQRESQIASIKMGVTIGGKGDFLKEMEEQNIQRYLGEEDESEASERSSEGSSLRKNSMFSSIAVKEYSEEGENSKNEEEDKDKVPSIIDYASLNLWGGSSIFQKKSGFFSRSLMGGGDKESVIKSQIGQKVEAPQQTFASGSEIDPNMGFTYINKESKAGSGLSDFL